HAMAQLVVLDLLFQLGDELRAFRSRPDQAHVAAQHVPQLRQLVDAYLADEAPDAGDAIVFLARPARDTILFRIRAHAAELDQGKDAVAFADPVLPVQHRRARTRFDPDGQRGEDQQRPQEQEHQRGRADIENALACLAQGRGIETVGKYQPGGIDQAQFHPALFAFEEGDQVGDVDAALLAGQQVLQGQAAAPVFGGDDDFVDLQALGQFAQRSAGGQQAVFGDHRFLAVDRNEADHDETAAVDTPSHAMHDLAGLRPRTEDQHTTFQCLDIDQPEEAVATHGHDREAEQQGEANDAATDEQLRKDIEDESDR